jgi:hypothetical protein
MKDYFHSNSNIGPKVWNSIGMVGTLLNSNMTKLILQSFARVISCAVPSRFVMILWTRLSPYHKIYTSLRNTEWIGLFSFKHWCCSSLLAFGATTGSICSLVLTLPWFRRPCCRGRLVKLTWLRSGGAVIKPIGFF